MNRPTALHLSLTRQQCATRDTTVPRTPREAQPNWHSSQRMGSTKSSAPKACPVDIEELTAIQHPPQGERPRKAQASTTQVLQCNSYDPTHQPRRLLWWSMALDSTPCSRTASSWQVVVLYTQLHNQIMSWTQAGQLSSTPNAHSANIPHLQTYISNRW